jgi:phage terminase large subunit-like protein
MADCVEVMQDPSGNIKPTKPDRRKSAKRIDGIAALVNAIARAMLRAPAKKRRRAGGVA